MRAGNVLHAGLETLLPAVKVHAGELTHSRGLDMDVERLALADEGATVGGHVEDLLLTDLPDGLVDLLEVVGDAFDALDGAIVGDDHVLHFVIPQLEVDKFAQEPGADNLELASKNTTCVDVAINSNQLEGSFGCLIVNCIPGVGLKTLIEAQDLTGRRSRHRGKE